MSRSVSLVAVSGSLHSPSKTTVLVGEILAEFAEGLRAGGIDVETHLIELGGIGRDFSGALRRDELSPPAEDALRRIESATLIIEHQFRPIFSFFQALTLPIGVYASDADFVDYRIASESLRERLKQAVGRGLPVVRGTLPDAVSAYVATW